MLKSALIDRVTNLAKAYGIVAKSEVVDRAFRFILEPAQPKSCVLFLHGAGNDALFPQAPFLLDLAKSGHLVVSLDLPGHGKFSEHELNASSLTSDVAEHVEKIGQQVFKSKIWNACGYSLGGALCIDTLTKLSTHPEKILLIATPKNPVINLHTLLSEARLPLLRSFWSHASFFGSMGPVPAFGPFKRGQFPVRVGSKNGHYLAEIGLWFSKVKWENNLKSFRGQALSIHADWDMLAPQIQMESLVRSKSNFQVQRILRQTHFSILLSKELADASISWLHTLPFSKKEQSV